MLVTQRSLYYCMMYTLATVNMICKCCPIEEFYSLIGITSCILPREVQRKYNNKLIWHSE